MRLVSIQHIKSPDLEFIQTLSCAVYNQLNFFIRWHFIFKNFDPDLIVTDDKGNKTNNNVKYKKGDTKQYLYYKELVSKYIKTWKVEHIDKLNAWSVQELTKTLYANWSSYYALKDKYYSSWMTWQKPSIPWYKKKYNNLVFTWQRLTIQYNQKNQPYILLPTQPTLWHKTKIMLNPHIFKKIMIKDYEIYKDKYILIEKGWSNNKYYQVKITEVEVKYRGNGYSTVYVGYETNNTVETKTDND